MLTLPQHIFFKSIFIFLKATHEISLWCFHVETWVQAKTVSNCDEQALMTKACFFLEGGRVGWVALDLTVHHVISYCTHFLQVLGYSSRIIKCFSFYYGRTD